MNLVDVDGKKINYTSFNSNPKFAEEQVNMAIDYLRENGAKEHVGMFEELRDSEDITIYMELNDSKSNQFIDISSTPRIIWQPNMAYKTPSGKTQSPALSLLHEIGHAWMYLNNMNEFYNLLLTKDNTYGNLEEKRVIETIESPAANALGEGTRNCHTCGQYFKVKSPIDRGK